MMKRWGKAPPTLVKLPYAPVGIPVESKARDRHWHFHCQIGRARVPLFRYRKREIGLETAQIPILALGISPQLV
jgi:hypothetical protein